MTQTRQSNRPMSRRHFLVLSGAAAAYPFLAGCGGGGGSASPQGEFFSARNVVIKPKVVVLPGDGSVLVGQLTDTELTLSGRPPVITPGTVLVGSEAPGFVRRVVTVTPAGAAQILTTETASLEDVFESAEVRFRTKLSSLPEDSIQTHAPGVRVGRAASRQDNPEGIPLVIPEFSIGTEQSGAGIAAKFSANGTLNFDLDGELDFTLAEGLRRVSLVLAADYNGSFNASTEAEIPLIDLKSPLFTHVFSPRRIGNIGPVPIFLISVLTARVSFKGSIKGGFGTSGDGFFRLAVGFNGRKRPSGDYDFSGVFAPTQNGTFNSPNFFGSIECEWVPWQFELVTSINALVGPTFKANLPAFKASVTPHPIAHSVDVDVSAAFGGSVGAQAGLFGLSLPLFEIPTAESKRALFKHTFQPGDGAATVR